MDGLSIEEYLSNIELELQGINYSIYSGFENLSGDIWCAIEQMDTTLDRIDEIYSQVYNMQVLLQYIACFILFCFGVCGACLVLYLLYKFLRKCF